MKKIHKNSIEHIEGTPRLENIFLFQVLSWDIKSLSANGIEIIDMRMLLWEKKNTDILEKVSQHPAMWSEVYRPKDELEIFQYYFDMSLREWKKIHIVWISLEEEVKMLEKYYLDAWFFSEEINCFKVDFSKVLFSASVYIENLMWRGSDYKRMREKIFFCPPIRESGQVKSLFTGINRGSIAGLVCWDIHQEKIDFLSQSLLEEHILPITLWKVVYHNFMDIGLSCRQVQDIQISF